MKEYKKTMGTRVYKVRIYSDDSADVYWQTVNPKTGEGWQRSRNLQAFRGDKAKSKAMLAWMKAIRAA